MPSRKIKRRPMTVPHHAVAVVHPLDLPQGGQESLYLGLDRLLQQSVDSERKNRGQRHSDLVRLKKADHDDIVAHGVSLATCQCVYEGRSGIGSRIWEQGGW
jgi:hypothetical protein